MIKYELSHDTIARQIYEKTSADAKARRKVQLMITRAYQRFGERGVLLTQEDLDELKPHEKNIPLQPEELDFIQQSKRVLQQKAIRRRQLAIGIILALTTMLLFALWQWRKARASAIAQKRVTLAIQAREALDNGDASLAYRLAEAAYHGDIQPETQNAIQEVLEDLDEAGLTVDFLHDGPVQALAIAEDEQRFLTGSEDGKARLWDALRKLLFEYSHSGAISQVAFSPWDQHPVTASLDSSLCFWDGKNRCVFSIQHGGPITGFQMVENRNLILITSPKLVSLYDRSGILLKRFMPGTTILSAALSPNGSDLLLATVDKVEVWNTFFLSDQFKGQDIEGQFCTLEDNIQAARFIQSDARNVRLLVISKSGIHIYDRNCEENTPEYTALTEHLGRYEQPNYLTFSYPGFQDPKTLWVTEQTKVRMWSAYRDDGAGKPKTDLNLFSDTDQTFYCASFSPSDRYLLISSATNWVNIWNLGFGQDITRAFRFKSKVTNAVFSSKDHWLLTTSGGNTAQLWDLSQKATYNANRWLQNFDLYSKRLRPLTDKEKEHYLN
ncbi:MAG: hypothetical protein DHS20C18_17220 [Saprospiraceae bacterium]|nr:MAG: hypothetical protein DHS20C18_17220 [Saprospiraceae bacterium]